ncbi:MAG: hypothetical protein K0U36_02570, partial [Alphaproteobacteria bacterium]|nr:hypothetical protein [Alphaproteobacteria bacterium]
ADVRSAFTQLFLGTETYSETFKVRREAFIALHVEEDSVWGTIARFLAEKSARGYMQLKRRLEDVEK